MDNISVCGSDCAKCYCFGDKCPGCNVCKGRVFHAGGAECAIYACCVTKNGYDDCLSCEKLPCGLWQKTRDPKFTDEEFEQNVAERIGLLKSKAR